MGIFITFEGIEGCGKSYQSKALYRKLLRSGYDAVLTLEPGGTPLGNAVRRLLKGTAHREEAIRAALKSFQISDYITNLTLKEFLMGLF